MRRRRDDRGTTLAEMMVVVMLLGVVGALVLSFTVAVSRNMSKSQVMNDNTNQATAATNEMTRLLRGAVNLKVRGSGTDAPALVTAGKTSVTFYTVVDTDAATTAPMKVRFEVTAAGDLVETRWKPDAGSSAPYWTFNAGAAPASTRVVAHGLTARPGSGKTLFTYLKSDQQTAIVGGGADGALTDAQRATAGIGAVRVTVEVQTGPSSKAKSTVLTNTVGLRNLPEGSS